MLVLSEETTSKFQFCRIASNSLGQLTVVRQSNGTNECRMNGDNPGCVADTATAITHCSRVKYGE